MTENKIDVAIVESQVGMPPDCDVCGRPAHAVIYGGRVGVDLCQRCCQRLCQELCR